MALGGQNTTPLLMKLRGDREFIERVKEKQRLIETIAVCRGDEKVRYFNQIKELNKLNLNKIEGEFQKKQKELDVANINLTHNEVVRFREYPVCIYPMKALRDYILYAFSGG